MVAHMDDDSPSFGRRGRYPDDWVGPVSLCFQPARTALATHTALRKPEHAVERYQAYQSFRRSGPGSGGISMGGVAAGQELFPSVARSGSHRGLDRTVRGELPA